MAAERAPRQATLLALSLTGVLLVAGCLSPPPSRESAPSPAPAPVAPPAPPAPAEPATPPPPTAAPVVAPSAESKASSGALDMAIEPGEASPSNARPQKKAPAPRRKAEASKGRSRALQEERDDGALGGAAGSGAPAALERELEGAERAPTPDCPAARERKKAVCDLAGQICRLTERDPNVASVAEYCSNAKQRCSDAERRTAERCPD